jgi:hypothetical protein
MNSGNWLLEELDCMYFWEREIYIKLLNDYNEKMKQRRKDMEMNYGRG